MKNIAAKLVKVMSDCDYVQKQGKNTFNNYKYATAANVLEKVNESLVKNNVASFAVPELLDFKDVTTNTGKTEHLATVKILITLFDGDSGESITIVGLGSGQDNGDKAVMKAQTAALKYAWMLTLNISTGDDPEADNGVDERTTTETPTKQPKPQTSKNVYADKKSQTNTNIPATQQKPNATQPAKPQEKSTKATEGQVKSLYIKATKEGLTREDVHMLIKWKYNIESTKDLTVTEFVNIANNLSKLWAEFVAEQSK
jgi:hypothetical protein